MESVEAQTLSTLITTSSFLRSKCQHVLQAAALLLGLGGAVTVESRLHPNIERSYFRLEEAVPETSLERKSGTTKLLLYSVWWLYLSLERCGRESAGGAR